mmetsp:Transcript_11989/g.33238  ORF Transcript_11989/g.33238 Transcript_11989/m.33238 type:complete len:204 (+) Transcript_11989:135-746(+)
MCVGKRGETRLDNNRQCNTTAVGCPPLCSSSNEGVLIRVTLRRRRLQRLPGTQRSTATIEAVAATDRPGAVFTIQHERQCIGEADEAPVGCRDDSPPEVGLFARAVREAGWKSASRGMAGSGHGGCHLLRAETKSLCVCLTRGVIGRVSQNPAQLKAVVQAGRPHYWPSHVGPAVLTQQTSPLFVRVVNDALLTQSRCGPRCV